MPARPCCWLGGDRRACWSPTRGRHCTCTSTANRVETVCGIVGALELTPPADRVVLPHEDVMEPIIADRLAMMTAAQANLEPIMLVYDSGGAVSSIVNAARAGTPLVDVRTPDGSSAPPVADRRSRDDRRNRPTALGPPGPDRRRTPPLCHLPSAASGTPSRRSWPLGPRPCPADRPVAPVRSSSARSIAVSATCALMG